ncbi:MAG: dephospho-CoA kinase [Planctomycetota bacterium]
MTETRTTNNHKPVVGLTGAPGSGKSTVAQLLKQRGGAVIDADALARAAFDEPPVREQLRKLFGHAAFHSNGSPNRKIIAAAAFADASLKEQLEAIIHPRVAAGRAALHQQYANDATKKFLVEDCPLLIETGLHDACDKVLLVDTPRDVRLARLADSRSWTDAQLAAREAHQLPFDTRRAHAHDVFSNQGSPGILAASLDELLQTWGWLDARSSAHRH